MILSKENYQRLVRHMHEDKGNKRAKESLERGRRIMQLMNEAFKADSGAIAWSGNAQRVAERTQ